MAFTSKRKRYAKCIISMALFFILAIAYMFMYSLQAGFNHANLFEDVDCTLFHLSLPSSQHFEVSDIEEGDLDPETIAIFRSKVLSNPIANTF